MTKTLTVKEVADQLDTDPRTLRKFLRKEVRDAGGKVGEDTPGKGGRYALEAKQVTQLRKRFAAWEVKESEARSQRAAARAAEKAAEADDAEDIEETEADDEAEDD